MKMSVMCECINGLEKGQTLVREHFLLLHTVTNQRYIETVVRSRKIACRITQHAVIDTKNIWELENVVDLE